MEQKQPLKILQVASHRAATRGGAVQMILLARGLRERGHDVHCVFHRPIAEPETQRRGFLHSVADLSPRLFNLNSAIALWRFRRWVCDEEFDVIHSHRDPALRFCFLATLGLSVPVFVTQRGTVYRLPRWGIVRWAFRSRKLDRVIAVAEAVRRSLIEKDRLPPGRIEVVYGGYDSARFHRGVSGESVRFEFMLSADVPVVGIVGALVGKKGHADFFDAAARIVPRLPAVRFMVVGEGKPERFADLLERLGLSQHVIFTGHRDDMPEVLAALNVLVCASTKGEGLTGSLREAMAVGTPVVTTDVAGNTELVIHERTGLVVPIAAADAMADAVLRLLVDREDAKRMCNAAAEYVRGLCLNSNRSKQIEAIYSAIFASKQAQRKTENEFL